MSEHNACRVLRGRPLIFFKLNFSLPEHCLEDRGALGIDIVELEHGLGKINADRDNSFMDSLLMGLARWIRTGGQELFI
ncbi:hypothetical protein RGQ15_07775 [Paracoccus sp. MBLB3053]|uniref:Uncharacterized protein n=1 Tax=Paracoccus aurantius TaxID=3073814 RepID=A0ABU2HR01_9RHOB|nr:hypothetical protein [Paracoccus sp. MBLB3053]MDS9467472.1 hypothetical protein [Paracoccus sp. MBLB3053]